MNRKHIILFLAILTVVLGCRSKSVIEPLDQSVLREIIPVIIDSICKDTRIYLNPPPMLGEFKETGDGHVIIDTNLATKEQKHRYKIWKHQQDSILLDTSLVYLAFDPKISYSKDSLRDDFEKHFVGEKLSTDESEKNKMLLLNIDEFKLPKHFKFKDISKFERTLTVWNKKYDFNFSGFFHVSRILFSKNRNFGILEASYTCGGLCGEGFIIYIKKQNGKWIIDKIKNTWIA